MKKFFLISLLFAILFPLESAQAADKPCPKTKLNVISKNLICTKVGLSYRWVPVKTNQPTITINTNNLFKNIDDVNLSNFNSVYNIANNNIDTYSKNYISNINIISSPNVDISKVLIQKQILEKSINLWSSIYTPQKVTVWFFTYEDKEWVINNLSRKDIKNDIEKHYFNNPNYCANAGVWNSLENGFWVSKDEMYLCIGKGSEEALYSHHVGHEYTHIIQGHAVSRESTIVNYPIVCWAFEGMPTFYGIATSDIDIKHKDNFYKNSISSQFKDIVKSKQKIKTFFVNNSVSIPSCASEDRDLYVAGSLATEVLISISGHDKIMSFLKNLNTVKNWETSFYNTFGFTTDKFYDIVGEYIYNYYNGL